MGDVEHTELVPVDDGANTDKEDVGIKLPEFDTRYQRTQDEDMSLVQRIKRKVHEECACSKEKLKTDVLGKVPLINTLRNYQFRKWILGDIVAGLTVAVMIVPQSMGFSILASVPPIVGLYTSFFPLLVFALFTTSNHAQIGPAAMNAIMIGSVVQSRTGSLMATIKGGNITINETIALTDQLQTQQIAIATGVTLLAGIILIAMGLLRFGFVTTYMGEPFISGFISGVYLHIIFSQLKFMFGVQVPHYAGALKLFKILIAIFKNIHHTNVATLIISIISIAVLVGVKLGINERFKSKLPIPIPIDFIVTIVAILASRFGKFQERFGVHIVRNIPSGLPRPSVPNVEVGFIQDAFLIAVATYVLSFIVMRIIGKKNNYPIVANQELYSFGITHASTAFFSCMSVGLAPARSFMADDAGGFTQVTNVVAALIVLIALLVLAPFMEGLPICVLSVMIIVSALQLFQQYKNVPLFWRTDKYDLAIWLLTFGAIVFLDIDKGLIIGILGSAFVTIYRSQNANAFLEAPVPDTDMYLNSSKYESTKQISGIKILKYESPLYFATIESFMQNLMMKTMPPPKIKAIRAKMQEQQNQKAEENGKMHDNPDMENGTASTKDEKDQILQKSPASPIPHAIILDCSAISFIDTGGCKALARVRGDYANVKVNFMLAACTEDVRSHLVRVPETESMITECVYPTIHQAVMAAMEE